MDIYAHQAIKTKRAFQCGFHTLVFSDFCQELSPGILAYLTTVLVLKDRNTTTPTVSVQILW